MIASNIRQAATQVARATLRATHTQPAQAQVNTETDREEQ